MKDRILVEHLTYDTAKAEVITESAGEGQPKNVYMRGIFIQGGLRNHNGRIYPVKEISKAVPVSYTHLTLPTKRIV